MSSLSRQIDHLRIEVAISVLSAETLVAADEEPCLVVANANGCLIAECALLIWRQLDLLRPRNQESVHDDYLDWLMVVNLLLRNRYSNCNILRLHALGSILSRVQLLHLHLLRPLPNLPIAGFALVHGLLVQETGAAIWAEGDVVA